MTKTRRNQGADKAETSQLPKATKQKGDYKVPSSYKKEF